MTDYKDLQQYISDEVEANCDLCEKPMGVADTFELGKWVLHYDCYHIVLKRLEPLADILLAPQDE